MMRDAIGGTFMLRIIIVFIVLYIVFMCFTVSYAKTFRLKNGVIDILEHYQYRGSGDTDVLDRVNNYLASKAYNFGSGHSKVNDHCIAEGGTLTDNGACIIAPSVSSTDETYYQVYLYIVYSFFFFNQEIVMPVGGETDIIPA